MGKKPKKRPPPKDVVVRMRVSSAQRERWRCYAEAYDMSLSEWMRWHLSPMQDAEGKEAAP